MKTMKFVFLMTMVLVSSSIYSQQSSSSMTNQGIVKQFLNGFNDPSEIVESLALLADDYQFQNPMIKLESKAAFVGLAQEIGEVLTGIDIIRITDNGDWVAVFYEFTSSLPGLERNVATEWFRIENGMIKESHLIYDASEWRKVYERIESHK